MVWDLLPAFVLYKTFQKSRYSSRYKSFTLSKKTKEFKRKNRVRVFKLSYLNFARWSNKEDLQLTLSNSMFKGNSIFIKEGAYGVIERRLWEFFCRQWLSILLNKGEHRIVERQIRGRQLYYSFMLDVYRTNGFFCEYSKKENEDMLTKKRRQNFPHTNNDWRFFLQVGDYHFRVIAMNDIHDQRETHIISVSDVECESPEVQMRGNHVHSRMFWIS